MKKHTTIITSLQNPRIKRLVKMRKHAFRDAQQLLLVEGYRETARALANDRIPSELYFCPELFLGENENTLISTCSTAGTSLFQCSEQVFRKVAYRDRPDGLLMITPQVHLKLDDLQLPTSPLLIVAESIEKPGNLGTLLRSADAAGVDAVLVCDACTDIHNPNVVRASIGALFAVPVVETDSAAALQWLREKQICIAAATPDAKAVYTESNLRSSIALVVGSEQYGLRPQWLRQADLRMRIPMHGQCDSLNVAAAATIVLFEAVRQRSCIIQQ
jgi:TrmH family RNA methyltransferase